MNKKLGGKFYLSLIIFSLFGQIAWVVENMYLNVFLSKEFGADSYHVALMVSLSAITATLTTLLIGALSDKLGKRKIFICSGYIVWGLSILCFSLFTRETLTKMFGESINIIALGITLVILFDCLMTFFGSAANDACFNSWLTDTTDSSNRGKVEGINAMMPLVAILIVFGLLSGYANEGKWHIMFIVLSILTISAGILGIFTIQDAPLEVKKDSHYFKDIVYGFKPSAIKENKSLYAVIILFAIFGIGIQTFMTFLVQYYDATIEGTFLGFDKYVIIMAPAIILASVFTFFYGRLYDKIGFFKSILGSLSILIVGLFMLFIFKNPNEQLVPVFIGSLLMMSGWLGSNAIFGAKIRDLTPQGKVGLFQGIRIIGQVLIPMLIGPWLGAVSLSGNFTYDENVLTGGYSYPLNSNIFLAAGIVMILTLGASILVENFFLKEKQNEIN